MARRIVYSPSARRDITSILDWVDAAAGAATALAYVDRLELACGSLTDFPGRGAPRGGGRRSIVFERRAVILYRVGRQTVTILRVHHRGRDPAA